MLRSGFNQNAGAYKTDVTRPWGCWGFSFLGLRDYLAISSLAPWIHRRAKVAPSVGPSSVMSPSDVLVLAGPVSVGRPSSAKRALPFFELTVEGLTGFSVRFYIIGDSAPCLGLLAAQCT